MKATLLWGKIPRFVGFAASNEFGATSPHGSWGTMFGKVGRYKIPIENWSGSNLDNTRDGFSDGASNRVFIL